MKQVPLAAQAAMGAINANVAAIFGGDTTPNQMVQIFSKLNSLMRDFCLPVQEANPKTIAFMVTKGVKPTEAYELEMLELLDQVEECFTEDGKVCHNRVTMLQTFCPDVGLSAMITGNNGRCLLCFNDSHGYGLRFEKSSKKTTLTFIPPLRKG